MQKLRAIKRTSDNYTRNNNCFHFLIFFNITPLFTKKDNFLDNNIVRHYPPLSALTLRSFASHCQALHTIPSRTGPNLDHSLGVHHRFEQTVALLHRLSFAPVLPRAVSLVRTSPAYGLPHCFCRLCCVHCPIRIRFVRQSVDAPPRNAIFNFANSPVAWCRSIETPERSGCNPCCLTLLLPKKFLPKISTDSAFFQNTDFSKMQYHA